MASIRSYPGLVVRVTDGDSAAISVDLGWYTWRLSSIRLFGINAIELRDPGGAEARAHLAALLPAGQKVTVISHGPDKYGGRTGAQIILPDGRDVSTVMIADGYAVAWTGSGPRPTPPWPIPEPAP